jgi:hypothetical protein
MRTIRVQKMRRRAHSRPAPSMDFRDLDVVRAKEFQRGGRNEESVLRFQDSNGGRL